MKYVFIRRDETFVLHKSPSASNKQPNKLEQF